MKKKTATSPKEKASLAFVAIQAALKAGNLLRKAFGEPLTTKEKANPQDIVTQFDHAAETLIIEFIHSQFPAHSFLAEESGSSNGKDAPVLWIIDPLDGTMNFAHQIPLFAVSIAAVVNGQVEVGVIYHPMTNELYAAQRGRGAFLNGNLIRVSKTKEMKYAVGCTGFPYGEKRTRRECADQFIRLIEVGNPIRLIGSATVALSYVAAGRFDAFWGMNLQPWDLAAGRLLVEEAGGSVSHMDGSLHDLFGQSNIVATNKHLHKAMLTFLQ